ncbi:MAG: hypothetical protein QOI94_1462, partial [Acidobacteriaceae bacterium]|nr:hypothetical protein [Acidobacteriaceae bacterium]
MGGCVRTGRELQTRKAIGDGVTECRLTNIKAGENKFDRV